MKGRVLAAALAAAVAGSAAHAQDRPVHVIDTDPARVAVDGGTFFLAGSQVAVSVRNRVGEPVLVTLRAWAFDQDGRFKGSTTYCTPEWLDRGTRRLTTLSLETGGLQASDRVVVGVLHAAAARRRWQVVAGPEGLVAQARDAGAGRARLRMEERPASGPPSTPCPCGCEQAAASCDAQCAGAGARAFTCAPVMLDGCSAGCTCT